MFMMEINIPIIQKETKATKTFPGNLRYHGSWYDPSKIFSKVLKESPNDPKGVL